MLNIEKLNLIKDHKKFIYNQIEEFLFAGDNPCCNEHYESELISKGIAADVSLDSKGLDLKPIKYFFWSPIIQNFGFSIELFDVTFNFIDILIKRNIKTYVHSSNPEGYITVFLISYFMRKYKISMETASLLIKERYFFESINEEQKEFLSRLGKKFGIL